MKRFYRTGKLDTRMLVTYDHQGVRSWDSNSRKTVEPSRGPSAKILSKKIIKAFLGPVFDFGNREQHTQLFIMFVLKKKNRDRSFRPWDFRSTFMRSKSSFVWLRVSYSAPEVSELGAQTWHLSQKQMPNLKLNLKLKINTHGKKKVGTQSGRCVWSFSLSQASSYEVIFMLIHSVLYWPPLVLYAWSCLDRIHPVGK